MVSQLLLLQDFNHLPDWIESSEFVQQFRKDYPNEVIQLHECLVFELPQTSLNDILEISRILESCRFFGINNWNIFHRIITYFIENSLLIDELEESFMEFCSLWKCIRYFIKHGIQITKDFSKGEDTQLLILRYAHENGCPWNEDICCNAAEGGYLDCLMYAHENGCPWRDEYICSCTASGGNVDCLMHAHGNGCPWTEGTCQNAASGGHLGCLTYAHENGCPWNEGTCSEAAEGGHLDCLKYAHENGCPWTEGTCCNAATGGHLECLKYAHENGCPWNESTIFWFCPWCLSSEYSSHHERLEYAHKNGCPWDKDLQ